MRLIDADVIIKALDEALEDARNDGVDLMDVLKMELFKNFMKQIISYTPTVDADGLNAAHEDIGYEKGYRDGYAEALYETDNAEPMPTIEPASVVRCKDCKHRLQIVGIPDGYSCKKVFREVAFDDFCSWGERKEQ